MNYDMIREQARIALKHGWDDFNSVVLAKIDETTSREALLRLAFNSGAAAVLQMLVVEAINPMRYEIEDQRRELMPKPPAPPPAEAKPPANPNGPTHWPALPGHPEIRPPPILRR